MYVLMCHCFNLYHVYNNNYNNNTKITTIRSLFLSAYNLFANHTCTVFCKQLGCSNTQLFVHSHLHTRLIEFLLTLVCYILSFYTPTRSIKRTLLKQEVRLLAIQRTLSRPFVYVHSHTCLFIMLIVVGLFEWYCYLFIVYTLPLVKFVGLFVCLFVVVGLFR